MAAAATPTAMTQPIKRPVAKLRPKNPAMTVLPAPRSDFRPLPDNHLGADRNAVVEIGHIRVGQAEAARRHRGADGLRLVGAVNAIDRGAEIHGAGAERIARPAGHPARQIRLALDHFLRWGPVRPFFFLRDLDEALPTEAVAADAEAVTQCAPAGMHHIEVTLVALHDDRAGLLGGAIEHHRLLPLWIEL